MGNKFPQFSMETDWRLEIGDWRMVVIFVHQVLHFIQNNGSLVAVIIIIII